jgi:hypothetical protein
MLDAFSTHLTFLGKFPQYLPITFVSQYLSDHICFDYIVCKRLKYLIQYSTSTSSIWIHYAQVLNMLDVNSASYLWKSWCLFVLFGVVWFVLIILLLDTKIRSYLACSRKK